MNWYERHGINQKRWAAVRRAVFSRDDNCCQSCGLVADRPEVDHITPLHKGGDKYAMDNLQLLCGFPCHQEKTRRECAKPLSPIETAEASAWAELLLRT